MADAPTSCKEAFDMMAGRFNPEASKGLDAVYQFDLSGAGGGKWNAVIKDQHCQVNEGSHPSPSITISMSAHDYLELLGGRLNAVGAFMTGKLRVAGDMSLAMRLQSMFGLG